MQRLILNVLALIFLFVSCKGANEKDIISKKDFVKVLTEIYLTDSYLSTINTDSAKKVIFPLYDHTFKKYDLDSTTFKKNLAYYASDAEAMTKIYEEVGSNLKKMNEGYMKIDKAKMDSIRARDSIRNVRYQDSMTRINNFIALYEMQKNMILHYKPDSIRLNYKNSAHDFFEKTGLKGGYNLETYILEKARQTAPSPVGVNPAAVPVATPSTSAGHTSTVGTQKVPTEVPVTSESKEVKNPEKPPILLDGKSRLKKDVLHPKPVN
ncbi:DUF4296 domain-containing protein [Sphingobacterium sp. SRCM116780]|uniref:DUF4296 domain-containing protein n=1 Tax=Sphingobacterium sp. SRCM116780 TaxID=2907623 RepID=UPI001F3F843E|nr:DUF4296 domain-containing protein [Sphingobacterium sp. SRCM116780]UIR57659.1 DUF4296 domain-containing protein [Sphingobacterium sp. SRCM116780]